MNETTRVIIVGGGVLGTMHAIAARERGFEVVQLEREAEARGASVRNFGLVWVSGRAPGAELRLALRARVLWEELAGRIPGTGFRSDGSLTLARDDAELELLRQAAGLPDAGQRGFGLLDPGQVREVNPALAGEFAGGLWCRRDAIVEPRTALPALRRWLAGGAGDGGTGYQWLPGREATGIGPHSVRDQTGTWHRGDLVLLCPGAALGGLTEAVLHRDRLAPLRRVRLQMMQTGPFPGRLTTAVADGDSLRYYPAYDLPGRAGLAPPHPVAARHRMQLLLVQRADGGLTIGDTHEYDEPFGFDVDEEPCTLLRSRAESVLGQPLPPVRRRWAGVYSEVTGGGSLYFRAEAAPGVLVVTGPGGRGMTCSPAIAEKTMTEVTR